MTPAVTSPPVTVIPHLAVVGLTKSFADHTVLHELDLAVDAGTIVVVTGPPGAGTTTLARCLTGTYRPDGGSLVVGLGRSDGFPDQVVDLATADARTVAWLRTHHVAALDGPLAAPPRRPAVTAIARLTGLGGDGAAEALDRAGAGHLATTPIGRLRGADRRRVALAAALGGPAPIVVLDDPPTGPATGRWVADAARAGRLVVALAGDDRPPQIPPTAGVPVRTGRIENGAIAWQEP